MIDTLSSGVCFGNFANGDSHCAICLIRPRCRHESKKVASSPDYVPSLKKIKKSSLEEDAMPTLDVLMDRLVIALGTPAMSTFGSGRDEVALYVFSDEKEATSLIVAQDKKGNIKCAVPGVFEKDIPHDTLQSDVVSNAEIILGAVVK